MLKKIIVLVMLGFAIVAGGVAAMTVYPDQVAADGGGCSGC
jgi:hypothetical protein